MTFKIKLEDKAAFLNRLEKQDVPMDSSKIKDNKLEGYFEVDIIDPKQLEIVKSILKQSPKINIVKEMKKSLTKSELKEMVRQELQGVLAEKKKMKDEDKKEKLDEREEVYTGMMRAAEELFGKGDPFLMALGAVGTVALGIAKGPEIIEKVKNIANAAYQIYIKKDPSKAEKIKDEADKVGIDVVSGGGEGEINEIVGTTLAVAALGKMSLSTLGYLATVLGITGGAAALGRALSKEQEKTGKSATPRTDRMTGYGR